MDNFDLKKYLAEGKLNELKNGYLSADEFRREESPYFDAHGGNNVDFMDAMQFAQEYARYVASIALQEFSDQKIDQPMIDKFLSDFNL